MNSTTKTYRVEIRGCGQAYTVAATTATKAVEQVRKIDGRPVVSVYRIKDD